MSDLRGTSADLSHRKLGFQKRTLFLEPIREVLESDESDVIPCWALDSLESADMEARTAPCGGPQLLTLPERSDR